MTQQTVLLRDGTSLPLVGLGTYGLRGDAGAREVAAALTEGYRLLDTAAQYGNEAAVGEGMRRSGLPREQVLVTTKVAGGDQGRDATTRGVQESLRRLALDYVDILLIHWPNPSRGLFVETWLEMLRLREEGLVCSVGTSNFRPEQLALLHAESGEWPQLNQIQLSPVLPRSEAVAFHREHGIVTQAWGPLGGREGLPGQIPLEKVARRHGVTPSQVALRWSIEQNIVVIPKSSSAERRKQNLDLWGFSLSDADRSDLAALALGEEHAWDSRSHEEW
ncbi:aldo/keto reductase [Dermabacteraceae bacterium P13128]